MKDFIKKETIFAVFEGEVVYRSEDKKYKHLFASKGRLKNRINDNFKVNVHRK